MAPKTRLKKIRKLENKKIRKLAFALWRLNLDYFSENSSASNGCQRKYAAAQTSIWARVDGKLDRILNRKIARKSLGQTRVYATTCDESGIICAYFLLLFTFYVVIFVRFPVQMSQKSSCT